ncbi:hypothetical protein [Algivirga pacifica]|uniref:Uncharacterized protein n=1 Tax=Algivirga pacifica TaxID=1162670 RepID=A0ABP9DJA8_9BACT
MKTQNAIPKTLEESNTESLSDALWMKRRGYGKNIIDDLFNERLENDAQLQQLMQAINDTNTNNHELLSDWKQFQENNERFWNNVHFYLKQINDSTQRKHMAAVFEEAQATYNRSVASHEASTDMIQLRKDLLHDQKVMMKLLISLSMMRGYQEEELPDLQNLTRAINNYDTLLNQIAPYTSMPN